MIGLKKCGFTDDQLTTGKQLNMLADNLTRLAVKAEDLSEKKAKMDSFREKDQRLASRIRGLDRDIHTMQNQQVDKKQLHRIFRDLASLYSDAEPETKRRLLT